MAAEKAINPSPEDDPGYSISNETNQVSWDDGGGATSFDVWFGLAGNRTLRSSGQIETTWEIPLELDWSVVYEWRIDSNTEEDITTGDVWSFQVVNNEKAGRVVLYLTKFGNPTGNFIVSVYYNSDSDNRDDATLLVSKSVAANTVVHDSFNLFTFDEPPKMETGYYFITCFQNIPRDASNHIEMIGFAPDTGPVSDGWTSDDNGETWSWYDYQAGATLLTPVGGGGTLIDFGDFYAAGFPVSFWSPNQYSTVGLFFTATLPAKPVNPAPTDVASSIALGLVELTWEDGGGADDYDVYFGPSGNVTLRSSGQVGTSWALLDTLLYNTVYEWRIDANNESGTTTGDTWTFTALAFAPPVASGGGGGGGEFGGSGGLNNMVTVKRLVVAAANEIFFEDE